MAQMMKMKNRAVDTVLVTGNHCDCHQPDAMAVGVGLAFLQVNIIATALAIGCATLIMSTLGMMVGRFIGSIIGKKRKFSAGWC